MSVCFADSLRKAREADLHEEAALMKQFGDVGAVKAVDYLRRSELLLLIISTDSQSGRHTLSSFMLIWLKE